MTNADIGHLHLERVDPDRDATLIRSWVVQERAKFWMMSDYSVEDVRQFYERIDAHPTHEAYLALAGEEPAALFETYDPRDEEVGKHFDVRPGDVGVHFMLAPPARPRPGFTGTVMTFLMGTVFADPAVLRIVAEPDARNDKAVNRVRQLGFELGDIVELSTKPAQLVFLSRDSYEQMSREQS